VAGIDFEAEGLLGDLEGRAREARLALLQELADEGVSLDELRRAVDENRLVLLPVERVFEEGLERYTADEIAEGAGIEPEFLAKLLQALGAPIPEEEDRVYGEADLEAAKRARLFLDAGLPPRGVLETSRIIGISMANLAEANVDLVGEVFTQPGVDERELAMRYAAAAKTMVPLLGETLLHAYGIHLR
jgi:adenylate cyclase